MKKTTKQIFGIGILVVLILLLLQNLPPNQIAEQPFGYDEKGSKSVSIGSPDNGMIVASKFKAPYTGDIDSIWVYLTEVGVTGSLTKKVRVAIYDVDNLQASLNKGFRWSGNWDGWIEFKFIPENPSTVHVIKNHEYYLCVCVEGDYSGSINIYYDDGAKDQMWTLFTGGQVNIFLLPLSYYGFPDGQAPFTTTFYDAKLSIYAHYSEYEQEEIIWDPTVFYVLIILIVITIIYIVKISIEKSTGYGQIGKK